MPVPDLFLLIGLPGSGKSTYAAAWAAMDGRRRVVATDAIRSQLFGDPVVQGSWPPVEREVERQFRHWVRQLSESSGSAVMYDATNAEASHRRQEIALARACGFTSITGIWLNPSLEIVLVRNRQRDRSVPAAVILHMHQSLRAAPPRLEDGLDALVQIGSLESLAAGAIGKGRAERS